MHMLMAVADILLLSELSASRAVLAKLDFWLRPFFRANPRNRADKNTTSKSANTHLNKYFSKYWSTSSNSSRVLNGKCKAFK